MKLMGNKLGLLLFILISVFLTTSSYAAEKRFFNIELGCCYGSHWVSQLDVTKENQKDIVKNVFDSIGIYSIIETSSITRYQKDELGNLAYRYNLIIQSSGKPSTDGGSLSFSTTNKYISRYFLEKQLPKLLIKFDIGIKDLKIIGNNEDNVDGFTLNWMKL